MAYKVLIVDDTKFMRFEIKKVLATSPEFEVADEAENATDAIEKYKELLPDVVTMDITMQPPLNGIDALKGILKVNPKAKVVMVSAMGQESYVKEALLNGAKDFIVKPFKGERILEALRNALK